MWFIKRQVAECFWPNYQLLPWGGGCFWSENSIFSLTFRAICFSWPWSPDHHRSPSWVKQRQMDGLPKIIGQNMPACYLRAVAQKSDHDHSISPFLGWLNQKMAESSGDTKKHVNTPDLWTFCNSQNSRFQVTNFFWEVPWPNIFLGPETAVFFLCQGFFWLKKNPTVSNPSELEWPALQFLDLSKRWSTTKGESWFFLFLPIPHLVGCVFFADEFPSFFFHQKSWWNSNKAQVVGRNLANESIDKHPTSRGVSCFKSSLLVQGSCWQYQNRNITLTELRHYISRLLGKWCSSSIEGIYFSFQRGYVQCLEQVNQTYSPNADWIAW